MYKVRVTKGSNTFSISDLDCLSCAMKMMVRWEQLGYTCELLALNCL